MPDNIQIYVDPRGNNDSNNAGHQSNPVQTADKAFSMLPPSWRGSAEIIFAPGEYTIQTDALYLGTPLGPEASPLVIKGGYKDLFTLTAEGGSGEHKIVTTRDLRADDLIGAVLTRVSGVSSLIGRAVSIRGNTAGPTVEISLQQTIGPVVAGDTFKVQRPAVTLRPTRSLHVSSHDGRATNCTLIGIKFAPDPRAELALLNVRAHCDTCEFAFQSARGFVHTNARIHGGIEEKSLSPDLDPQRAQAGVYIHSSVASDIFSAVRNGVLSGHLTFKDITVRISQGGMLVPRSLESLRAPIQILTGGSALGQPVPETGQLSWGTLENKARIRDVAGDGLRIFNGGALNSPGGPIHLDISGCTGDGIRLDMGSTASFGAPGGPAGLVTKGAKNGKFGMNVRNASRALIGRDAAAEKLDGGEGEVALDGGSDAESIYTWTTVVSEGQSSNAGMSLVRVSK